MRKRKATSPTFGRIVRIARILVVGIIIGIDIVTAIINNVSGSQSSTSYTAHLSGVVMGLLVGLVILRNRRVQFWERWLQWACCGVAALLILVMILINIFWSSHFKPTDYGETECANFVH